MATDWYQAMADVEGWATALVAHAEQRGAVLVDADIAAAGRALLDRLAEARRAAAGNTELAAAGSGAT